MPREFSRTDRLATQLQRELSAMIRTELDDPVARSVTITEVRVSRDLSHARVYTSVLPGGGDLDEALEALRHSAGHFRKLLGRTLRLRTVPQLAFERDEAVLEGERISKLIDGVVKPAPSDDDRRE